MNKVVVTDFYQALNKPQSNNAKLVYQIWREKAGQYSLYIDADKSTNVRQYILKKEKLTSAEIKEINGIVREPTNSEKQNPEDVRVRMENMTLERFIKIQPNKSDKETKLIS